MSAVLVDTVIWIDHLRTKNPTLSRLLNLKEVLGHPWVVGELAVGNLSDRSTTLHALNRLPQAIAATHAEALTLVESSRLYGRSLGIVDIHLLASTLITPGARLWTRDRRLNAAAAELGVAY